MAFRDRQTRDEQVRKLVGNVVLKEKIFWMWVKIVIACIPGVLYGIFLDDLIETMTEPYKPIIVAVMLIVVGILFIIIETKHKGVRPKIKTIPDLTWQIALAIGFCQPSGYQPFRRDHHRRPVAGPVQTGSSKLHLFPGYPDNGGCQSGETAQVSGQGYGI